MRGSVGDGMLACQSTVSPVIEVTLTSPGPAAGANGAVLGLSKGSNCGTWRAGNSTKQLPGPRGRTQFAWNRSSTSGARAVSRDMLHCTAEGYHAGNGAPNNCRSRLLWVNSCGG